MDILYKAKATSTGGREGQSKTDDGKLEVKLSTPKEMGGSGGDGTNPEQLFAAGYSACFLGALKFVAGQAQVQVPDAASIRAEVGFGKLDHGFGIDVDLFVKLPGLDKSQAEQLVADAHEVCPYSNATRDNIDVRLHTEV